MSMVKLIGYERGSTPYPYTFEWDITLAVKSAVPLRDVLSVARRLNGLGVRPPHIKKVKDKPHYQITMQSDMAYCTNLNIRSVLSSL